MKEAVTKVIDTLTQEDFHGPFRSCWNGTTSALQPEEITSKGTISVMVRVLFNPRSSHTKDFKNGTWLTLSIIRYGSRVKWRNPGKGVASSPTPWCSSYRKRCLRVTLDYGRQLYFLLSINVPIRKKSGKLSYVPCINTAWFVCQCNL